MTIHHLYLLLLILCLGCSTQKEMIKSEDSPVVSTEDVTEENKIYVPEEDITSEEYTEDEAIFL